MPTQYADVTDTGVLVTQDPNASILHFGHALVPLPVINSMQTDAAMFVRAVADDDGRHWAIFKAHNLDQGNGILLCEDGRYVDLGPTFGNVAIALYMAGTLAVVLQTAVDVLTYYWVSTHTLEVTVGQQTGIPPTTKDAIADIFPQTINNPLDTTLVNVPCRFVTAARNGKQAAQATGDYPAQVLISDGVRVGTLFLGDCFEPHLSANGAYWVCRTAGNQVVSGLVPSVIPPLVGPEVIVPEISSFGRSVEICCFFPEVK